MRVRPPLMRIVIGLVVVVVPVVAIQWIVRKLGLPRMPTVVSAALISAAAGYLAYRAYVRIVEKRELVEFGHARAGRELAAGLSIGTALFSITIGILAALGVYRTTGAGTLATLIIPLAAALSAGVLEEIVFRGLIFRITEESLGTFWALTISGILFGLVHLIGPNTSILAALAIIFEAGILLAAAFVLTRRLWLCIGIHVAWNFTQGGIFGVPVSGVSSKGLLHGTFTGPPWLTGGDFGVEASVVAIVVCVIAGAVLLILAARKRRFVPRLWRKGSVRESAEAAR